MSVVYEHWFLTIIFLYIIGEVITDVAKAIAGRKAVIIELPKTDRVTSIRTDHE